MQVRSDHEQHRLLSMIERMQREGRSEAEIVDELATIGAHRGVATGRRSRTPRPARGRLARWAAARLRV